MSTQFYWTEDRHVARMSLGGTSYSGAGVLRDGKWVSTNPAELAWNAQKITRTEAITNLVRWVHDKVSEKEAIRLLDEAT